MAISEEWSNLINLTRLMLEGRLHNYGHLSSLPALQDLSVEFLEPHVAHAHNAPAELIAPGPLPALTYLSLASDGHLRQVGSHPCGRSGVSCGR